MPKRSLQPLTGPSTGKNWSIQSHTYRFSWTGLHQTVLAPVPPHADPSYQFQVTLSHCALRLQGYVCITGCTSNPTLFLTAVPYTFRFFFRFPYSYSQVPLVAPLSFYQVDISPNNLGNSQLRQESREIRQSIPIPPPISEHCSTSGSNLYRCYFQNAIQIYKTLANLSLSENHNFDTLQLNFLEMARDIRQTLNEFQLSAQHFGDAGASLFFTWPGLNLNCCCVI